VRRRVQFLTWIFCSALAGPLASAAAAESLRLGECRLESQAVHGSVTARCGHLRVRENRDDPQSKELQLHVAVIPALRLQPAPDPLFIISGGPGQSASDLYLSVSPAFARIRRDRDIVLVDQRGTGRSNMLDCTLPDDADFTEFEAEDARPVIEKCLAELPGNPRYYTTSIAVRDLEEVRAAGGYESINLYGASYGTRVAQHYMRRYPQRVRAVILDGVVPADLALGPDIALDAQRALDAAFERCARDQACARQFPEIAQQFTALLGRLRKEPVTVSIPDPITGLSAETKLDKERLAGAVRLLSYSDETTSTLPLLIHEAHSLREPRGLAAQYLMVKRAMDTQIAEGMHFSVVCSEDAPRWDSRPVSNEELARTYMGTTFMNAMRAVCALWPRGPVDEDFSVPLRSDIPTLILSGTNDPVTPPQYGEQVLRGLGAAEHLVLAGQGHGQLIVGCVPRLMAQFIDAGSAEPLDAQCIKNIAPAPFMLSRSAPAP
jgi:pimeloyl-ACP methyl ester carboxylesterase